VNPTTTPTTRREAFTTAGLALLAASVASSAQAAEAEDIGPDHLNVRSFGVKGDGTSADTAAFQKALDAAHAAGGGSVWVPTGSSSPFPEKPS
jgi:polygalacturonase